MFGNQKGIINILIIIILFAGILVGVYLIKHPQIFKSKAANDVTKIEVLDASGNTIYQTNTQKVNLKLTYVPPSAPTPSPVVFPADFQDVTQADGVRFGTRDDSGLSMDAAKIIDNPRGGYLAVYHTNMGNGLFNTYLATSNDVLNWHQLIKIDDHASMPYLYKTDNGGFLLAEEVTVDLGNYIRIFYYNSVADLLANHPSASHDIQRTLSTCNEGTPNIYSATLSPDIYNSKIVIGFHYYENCQIDREAKGTLTNFSSWFAQPESLMNSQLLNGGFGLASNSDFGQRDYIQVQGKGYNLMEIQRAFGDWSSWRIFLYDFLSQQFTPFSIHTANGVHSFANPHISVITSPSGKSALVITIFVPSEGAAVNEPPGELIYYREFNPPGSILFFPTSFRVANSQTELAGANEQNFNIGGQQIEWYLLPGNGPKTVFAEFKVNGVWSDPVSVTLDLEVPVPVSTPSSSPFPTLTPTPTPSPLPTPSSTQHPTPTPSPSSSPFPTPSSTPSPSPSPSPTPTPSFSPGSAPQPLIEDINNDGKVGQDDYNILINNFGKTGINIPGDLDSDGVIDIFDYNLLLQNYGKIR